MYKENSLLDYNINIYKVGICVAAAGEYIYIRSACVMSLYDIESEIECLVFSPVLLQRAAQSY